LTAYTCSPALLHHNPFARLNSENPGPSTNVGSALFNQCVIIGVSALVLPSIWPGQLEERAFWRDIAFYFIAIVTLGLVYDVITPGQIDLWESALLCGIWIA
jgi:Ca2+/Na+ antiporter